MKLNLLHIREYLLKLFIFQVSFGVLFANGRFHSYRRHKISVDLSKETAPPSIVIRIDNQLNYRLTNLEKVVISGKLKSQLPREIKTHSIESVTFEKSGWFSGTSGILAFNIDRQGRLDAYQMVIFFEIPYWSHNANWFGIRFIRRDSPVNKNLYDTTYRILNLYKTQCYSSPFALLAYVPNANRCMGYKTLVHEDYEVEACMATTQQKRSRLKISIKNKPKPKPSTDVDYIDSNVAN